MFVLSLARNRKGARPYVGEPLTADSFLPADANRVVFMPGKYHERVLQCHISLSAIATLIVLTPIS